MVVKSKRPKALNKLTLCDMYDVNGTHVANGKVNATFRTVP